MYGYAFAGSAPARRRDPVRVAAIAVFAAVVAVAAGAGFVAASSGSSFFPKAWDPRVAPIAAEVSHLRGLSFVHPVAIHYLSADAFKKQLGSGDTPGASGRAEIAREEAVFRALGLVGGKVDLAKAFDTSGSSSTLAFYDPTTQEIYVRGTTLDVEHRVTVAHELTHVLQDQHFDLRKLEKQADDSESGDAGALKALVEGDAVRIQDDYLQQLPKADRTEYQREDVAESSRIGSETASVPDLVSMLEGAPYEFGPSTIRVLLNSGGNAAVNQALTGPTPSTAVYVDPGDVSAPTKVDVPALPAGAVKSGDPEVFGPFETYLTLAQRIDPGRALLAADVVAGGRAVTYKSKGSTCYRVVVAPSYEHSRAYLLSAVRDWAHGRVDTTVDAVGDYVGFTACDPGSSARAPSSQRFHDEDNLLNFRAEIIVGATKSPDVSGAAARCLARVVLELPGAEKLVLTASAQASLTGAQTEQLRGLATRAGLQCRDNSDAGYP